MYYSTNSVAGRTYFPDSITNEDQAYLTPARPTSITLISGLLPLSLVYSLVRLQEFVNNGLNYPVWLLVYGAISLGMTIGAIAGLWRMKVGGAMFYSASYVLSIVAVLLAGVTVDIPFLVLPLILQFFIYRKLDLMD